MAFDPLYWHWLVLGVTLIVLEIFLASFTVIWFGLGALIVGVLVWLAPQLGLGGQLAVWILASLAFAIFWFRYFKPKMVDKTTAGISREAVLGETGQVIRVPVDGGRGTVRFTRPLLGEDEWDFICEGEVKTGDRVVVRDFSGNALVVERQGQAPG